MKCDRTVLNSNSVRSVTSPANHITLGELPDEVLNGFSFILTYSLAEVRDTKGLILIPCVFGVLFSDIWKKVMHWLYCILELLYQAIYCKM